MVFTPSFLAAWAYVRENVLVRHSEKQLQRVFQFYAFSVLRLHFSAVLIFQVNEDTHYSFAASDNCNVQYLAFRFFITTCTEPAYPTKMCFLLNLLFLRFISITMSKNLPTWVIFTIRSSTSGSLRMNPIHKTKNFCENGKRIARTAGTISI